MSFYLYKNNFFLIFYCEKAKALRYYFFIHFITFLNARAKEYGGIYVKTNIFTMSHFVEFKRKSTLEFFFPVDIFYLKLQTHS